MLESTIAQMLGAVKCKFSAFIAALPDEERLRVSAMEQHVRALMKGVEAGLWEQYETYLVERAEQEAGTCRCGCRCERRTTQVRVFLLGLAVVFLCVYFYCRRCRQGRSPVRRWLGLQDGGTTFGLERSVTNLTTQVTFGETVRQMKEQHGQELDRTFAERLTYRVGEHAEQYLAYRRQKALGIAMASCRTHGTEQLCLTADGGGIPVGELTRPGLGGKKERTPVRGLPKGSRPIAKREGRLTIVRRPGVVTERIVDLHIAPHNHLEVSGERMLVAAIEAGLRDDTRIHGVFDMGLWPRTLFQEQFREHEHTAVADIFHVAEYLAAAGKNIVGPDKAGAWAMTQKDRLLAGNAAGVLKTLARHQCAAACHKDEDGHCLVRVAHRYLTNHRAHLEYPEILARELPVGSGEAESAIRHIIRKRMDVAGAWTEAHANQMLSLLTIIYSGWWNDFWSWRDRQDLDAWRKRQRGENKPRFRGDKAGSKHARAVTPLPAAVAAA
jgi:hypothetical protein